MMEKQLNPGDLPRTHSLNVKELRFSRVLWLQSLSQTERLTKRAVVRQGGLDDKTET